MWSLFGANGSFENFESSGDHPCNKADISFPFLFFLQIDALPDNGIPPSGNSGARIACCVIEEYKRKNIIGKFLSCLFCMEYFVFPKNCCVVTFFNHLVGMVTVDDSPA